MPLILKANTVNKGYQYVDQYLKIGGVEPVSKGSCKDIEVYIGNGRYHDN
jgi:hypothetical protein